MTANTAGRQAVTHIRDNLKKSLGHDSGFKLDISPLGIFKLAIESPEVCDSLLANNPTSKATNGYELGTVGNRKRRGAQVSRLLTALKEDTWDADNGETIKLAIDEDDGSIMLIDGQHRLLAIRESLAEGVIETAEVTVITGMKPECVLTVDTGSSRSVSDFLTICGHGVKAFTTDVASAGRDVYRAFNNPDGHPCRNTSESVSEGDIARWLMSNTEAGYNEASVADTLLDIRTKFKTVLNNIANINVGGINAGAKSWMTYLLWEWLQRDVDYSVSILQFLDTGDKADLPKFNGSPQPIWKYARVYSGLTHVESGGFKASNKEAHDKTLLAYAIAWNYSRGKKGKAIKSVGGIKTAVTECYPKTGKETPDGDPIRARVPMWPGIN